MLSIFTVLYNQSPKFFSFCKTETPYPLNSSPIPIPTQLQVTTWSLKTSLRKTMKRSVPSESAPRPLTCTVPHKLALSAILPLHSVNVFWSFCLYEFDYSRYLTEVESHSLCLCDWLISLIILEVQPCCTMCQNFLPP